MCQHVRTERCVHVFFTTTIYMEYPTDTMRCRACLRTTPPSQAKSFSGFDFCRRCYDALGLSDLKKKDLKEYFLSLSNERNNRLFEALTAVASRFDKEGADSLLLACIQAMGNEGTSPEVILTFLLAAKALQESEGTAPLTKVGERTLINMSAKLAHELVKKEKVPLDDDLPDYEIVKAYVEQFKRDYSTCIDVLNHMEPSSYVDDVMEYLNQFQNTYDLMTAPEEVNLSEFQEGVLIECSEDLSEVISDHVGSEHLCTWGELKETFEELKDDFMEEKIHLIIPEDFTYDDKISLLVGEGEIFLTNKWEELKEAIHTENGEHFIALQKEIPPFVLERAAGGMAPLQKVVEKFLPENPENVDLILSYMHILGELEKSEEAIAFLEKKVSEMPEETALLADLAAFMIEAGQEEKAVEFLQKISEMQPENSSIFSIIGQLYESTEDFRKAEESYQKALELNPKQFYLVGAIKGAQTAVVISDIEELFSQENYEKALPIVDEHIDPFDISIFYYYKGVILSRMGNPREALTFMADYLDIFPEDEDGWMEKAWIYLELGQFMPAARCFKRWSILEPYDIMPLVWEALCYKKLGRTRSYKRCINKARRIDPEGTKALLKQLAF